ncbi:MAG TPA: hypothetical protein VM290_07160 [Gaiellaceae bacterium]|nr:hypothetical protein [Gaiellaceae bacterium]
MLSERARRLGSTALILGGVAWAVVWFAAPLVEDEGPWRAALNPALVLVAAGVWVFYVRLGSAAAGLGLVAAALVVVGTVAMLLANLLARDLFAVAALVTIAAHLLLGVAIVRTGVLPRETGLAFAGGLAAVVAGAMLPPLLGVGWLLWGYVLLAAPPVEVPAEYR